MPCLILLCGSIRRSLAVSVAVWQHSAQFGSICAVWQRLKEFEVVWQRLFGTGWQRMALFCRAWQCLAYVLTPNVLFFSLFSPSPLLFSGHAPTYGCLHSASERHLQPAAANDAGHRIRDPRPVCVRAAQDHRLTAGNTDDCIRWSQQQPA